MRALVISGGGSKGAFAGGVAQYLTKDLGRNYDMYLGTSTGSLLVPHLAANDVGKLYNVFTNVEQRDIFSISPFVQRQKGNREYVSIDFVNSLWQFIRMKRTFGESKSLKRYIRRNLTKEEFDNSDVLKECNDLSLNNCALKFSPKDIKYIFVKSDTDIPDIINFIQSELDNFPGADLKILMSRVISLENIKLDM